MRNSNSDIRNIFVASIGDWHFKIICNALASLGINLTSYNSTHLQAGNIESMAYTSLATFSKIFTLATRKQLDFFHNPAVYWSFRAFDHFTAREITKKKHDVAILWSGMSKLTLQAAKHAGIRTILVMGNSPLSIYESRVSEAAQHKITIPQPWKSNQLDELRLTDKVLVESHYVAAGLLRTGIPKEKVAIIPPHVSTTDDIISYPDAAGFCVIQPNQRKGISKILSWWRQIKHPSPLLLIGHPHEINRDIVSQCHNVHVLGHLNGKAFDEAISRCHVALFPTFEDGGPRALFECMERGLCVISSEFSAAPDHISNGDNGFIIPQGSDQAWIDKIDWCNTNRSDAIRIGKRAQKYVRSHLRSDMLSQRLAALLDELDQIDNRENKN